MRPLIKAFQVIENVTSVQSQKCKHRHIHFSHHRLKATIIDGVKRALTIQEELRHEVVLLKARGFQTPHLATIVVGDDYVSHVYVKRKLMAAKYVGISTNTILLESSIKEAELVDLIISLNEDKSINGVLVQLPLPAHICERTICNVIRPAKDVDGFSFMNMGKFVLNMDSLLPCTAMAVQDLIISTGIRTRGKHAVVCGRSKNVGLPIAMILHASHTGEGLNMDATTTICHRFTPHDQLCALTKSADILISATGVPGLITSEMVKPGACVIDVGISRLFDQNKKQTQLIGDVRFDEVSKVAGFLTPVPGGVGPMTVAMLLKNTVKATLKQIEVP